MAVTSALRTVASVIFWVLLGVLWGGAFASFSCVVVERGLRDTGGRSHCICGRQLTWYENIPVVSWAVLRGRARCCRASIPAWYWYAEIVGAAGWGAAAAIGQVYGLLAAAVVNVVVVAAIRHRRASR